MQYKIAAIYQHLNNKGYSFPTLENPLKHKLLFANGKPIFARIAQGYEELGKGLMGVAHLDPNEGCLLCFPNDTLGHLYMKNCKINLQAAMIDHKGTIIDILDMTYDDPYRIYTSRRPIRYALEMSENFFTNNNIKIGDSLVL